MREGEEADVSVGGYQDSSGHQGVSVTAAARLSTYVNGSINTDETNGVYLDPGVTVRSDVRTGGKVDRVEANASVGAIYRIQTIEGEEPTISVKAQRYQHLSQEYAKSWIALGR